MRPFETEVQSSRRPKNPIGSASDCPELHSRVIIPRNSLLFARFEPATVDVILANCQENPHCSKIPNVPVINLPGKWKCNSLSEHTILPSNQSIMYTICTQRKTNNRPFQAIPYLSTSLVITIQYGGFFLHQSIDTLTFYRVYERRNCVIVHIEPTDNNQIRFKNTNKWYSFHLVTAKYTPKF